VIVAKPASADVAGDAAIQDRIDELREKAPATTRRPKESKAGRAEDEFLPRRP